MASSSFEPIQRDSYLIISLYVRVFEIIIINWQELKFFQYAQDQRYKQVELILARAGQDVDRIVGHVKNPQECKLFIDLRYFCRNCC